MRKSSKKRPYRAVHLSGFEWDGICERLKSRHVVVGVDVAQEAMVAAVMDDEEVVVKTVRWSHPIETDEFLAFVERLDEAADNVTVAMEPSGVYGDALRWQLHRAGFEVFRVSPKKSHDMSEIYDGVPSSHDGKSAAIVAVLHSRGASEPWPPESERKRELTAALRLVEVFGKQFRQNRNRLEGLTARHWPELTLTLELGTATALELLTAFGGPAAVAQESEEARSLMKRVGGAKLASEKVEAVLTGAACSKGVPLIEEEERLVRGLAAEARRNQLELRKAQRRVEELASKEGATKEIAPLVGKTTAAVLVAGVGDPRQFESPQALVKASGLNLRERSSGTQKGGLHITKRGSGEARMYLWMAALRLLQSDPVIRAWYAKKVKRQGGKAKAKAVVAVMRKLMLALWHVARGEAFDATKLFDIRRLGVLERGVTT
jgi:transposase